MFKCASETQGQFTESLTGNSLPSVTRAPGDLIPSSSIYRHPCLHNLIYVQIKSFLNPLTYLQPWLTFPSCLFLYKFYSASHLNTFLAIKQPIV